MSKDYRHLHIPKTYYNPTQYGSQANAVDFYIDEDGYVITAIHDSPHRLPKEERIFFNTKESTIDHFTQNIHRLEERKERYPHASTVAGMNRFIENYKKIIAFVKNEK